MDENKDVEIVLDDPKQPVETKKDEPEIIVEDSDSSPVEVSQRESAPDAALQEMEKKLEKAKKKAERFEREKAEAEAKAHQAMQEAGENRKHVMMAALNQIKSDADLLSNQFAEAMSINNYELAGKIQQQMAANEVRKVQFEAELENIKRQEAPQQSGSQLDQIIKAVSPESARWLKQNREHLDDDRAIRRMFRAHEDAVDDGIKPDTDEYFTYIEKRLGISDDEPAEKPSKRKAEVEDADDEPMSVAAKPKAKAAPPPPAPVERYGSRPNVVRLTRAEAETAQMLGMTEKEYATHKLALQKEGKLPH